MFYKDRLRKIKSRQDDDFGEIYRRIVCGRDTVDRLVENAEGKECLRISLKMKQGWSDGTEFDPDEINLMRKYLVRMFQNELVGRSYPAVGKVTIELVRNEDEDAMINVTIDFNELSERVDKGGEGKSDMS